jgi:Holliday junction resolvase RusA-like endonuclease
MCRDIQFSTAGSQSQFAVPTAHMDTDNLVKVHSSAQVIDVLTTFAHSEKRRVLSWWGNITKIEIDNILN